MKRFLEQTIGYSELAKNPELYEKMVKRLMPPLPPIRLSKSKSIMEYKFSSISY